MKVTKYMATPVRVNEDNYVRLESEAKKERRSVTSQLNAILDERYGRNTVGIHIENTPLPKKTEVVKVGDNTVFRSPNGHVVIPGHQDVPARAVADTELPDPEDIRQSNAEQDCCKNDLQPCKHWVWDTQTGEGYRNTLSGRVMEVE